MKKPTTPKGTPPKRHKRMTKVIAKGHFKPKRAATPKAATNGKRAAEKAARASAEVAPLAVPTFQAANDGISEEIRNCLKEYNFHYRKSLQQKLTRPDLKVYTKMVAKDGNALHHYREHIGEIPGVPVGSQFFSRVEVAVTGVHGHWLNGINTYRAKGSKTAIAVSVVLSGGYEDDEDEGADVIYTGQGGNDLLGKRQQIAHQEMKTGNLALFNSIEAKNPVRLIRGLPSKQSYTGKIYTYDGLYQVMECREERGKSNFIVFKYRLARLPGQPVMTTQQVQFCKGLTYKRDAKALPGLVADDISGGQENIKIHAVNLVDDPPVPPPDFVYTNHNILPTGFKEPEPAPGCNCVEKCLDPPKNSRSSGCACAMRNGGSIPYTSERKGRLVEARNVVYECGPKCNCGIYCPNRTVQQGIRFQLEVFKTEQKGWALRSWDMIPSGAPVCEYTGVLITSEEADALKDNDEYIYGLDCKETALGIGGRQARNGNIHAPTFIRSQMDEDGNAHDYEYCVDAKHYGSVARFANHSCTPNMFMQCVFYDHDDLRFPHLWLFAAENIVPLTELTYDYGYVVGDDVLDSAGNVKNAPCHCGSRNCSGRLF